MLIAKYTILVTRLSCEHFYLCKHCKAIKEEVCRFNEIIRGFSKFNENRIFWEANFLKLGIS